HHGCRCAGVIGFHLAPTEQRRHYPRSLDPKGRRTARGSSLRPLRYVSALFWTCSTPQPFMMVYSASEIGGCHVELASSHACHRICLYHRRYVDRRRPGGREWFVQPRISTVASTAKRVLMVPSRVAMRPPWLFLAGALSTADFRHLISLASAGS